MARNRIAVNQLPSMIGKSQSYWSRRVNADQPMDVDDLEALASLLEVPASSFFVVRRQGLEPRTRCVEAVFGLTRVDELAERRAAVAATAARNIEKVPA